MKLSFYAVQFSQRKLFFGLLTVALFFCSAVTTFAAPGDLDTTFGNAGKVITPVGNASDLARDLAVQPDGKIVVVGVVNAFTSAGDFAVVRYNTNGVLDATFGNGGKVITPVSSTFYDDAFAVVIQPDGKILVAGYSSLNEFNTGQFALVRYNPNGTLDANFGTMGIVLTTFGPSPTSFDDARANDIILQPDGKIVLTGRVAGAPGGYAAARYNADGSLDMTFGNAGKFLSNTGNSFPSASALQSDGKIVITGYMIVEGTNDDFATLRLNSNGTLDTSFGTNGIVTTPVGTRDDAFDVAIQPDSKIVVVGSVGGAGAFSSMGIVRYNPNGSLDTTFDGDGKFVTVVGSESDAQAVVIQPDNKIVVAGYGTAAVGGNFSFALIRCNPNGSLDNTFGSGGKVNTSFSANTGAQAKAVALQPDGKIVVAGNVIGNNQNDFGVVRYLNDTFVKRRPLYDFDGDGKADQAVFRPSNGVWYLLRSQSGFTAAQFGNSTDRIAPADFDGDGRTDIAVFRDGFWYWLNSSSSSFNAAQFGTTGDAPVPADYTGDGRAELAVYRGGFWYTLNLTNNQFQGVQFGISSDSPVPADFDADGKTDYAVYREGIWYLLRSTAGFTGVQFGNATDKPTVGDFDGDGRADQAVFRSGIWYILGSTQGFSAVQFGLASDIPVAADYDGDGKTDVAVFRDGVWYMQRSQQGFGAVQFGTTNDRPIPAAFVP